MYRWNMSVEWGLSRLWFCDASNTLMGPLHVALCGGGTRVEVSCYSFGGEIGAPFEEDSSDCFEECCDTEAAHLLMGKLDAVGLGLDNGVELRVALDPSMNSSRRSMKTSCSSGVSMEEVLSAGPTIGRVHRSVVRYFVPSKIICHCI